MQRSTRLTADERDELRRTARGLLADRCPPSHVRGLIDENDSLDTSLWAQMVELGWTSIHLPERSGGAGCGYRELAVILEELGRALAPTPFLASAVLAARALVAAPNRDLADALLAQLASGEAIGTVALAGTNGSYDPLRTTTQWAVQGSTVRLSGAAGFVLEADRADTLIVGAHDAAGRIALAVDPSAEGVRIERAPSVDKTRRLFSVSFDDVTLEQDRLLAEPGEPSARLLDDVVAVGAIAAAADAVGVAARALDVTTDYARERTQFGKPIGSFQAVKHHCANMAIAVEASRAAVTGAADALDDCHPGWIDQASVCSSFVGPACSEATALALRVHGGIGFTWEHDAHLFLKRAKLNEALFGTPAWHRHRLADAVFPAMSTGIR